MSPDCDLFVDLYDEMIDLRASIREKDKIIKQQNMLIEKLKGQLNKVTTLLSEHATKLQLGVNVLENDGKTSSEALDENEMQVLQLLQGVMVDLIDMEKIDDTSEVTTEEKANDSIGDNTDLPRINPFGDISRKNFSIFDKPQPRSQSESQPTTTQPSTEPVKRARKVSSSCLVRELDDYIKLISSGDIFLSFPCLFF
jgi:hypothetical protein